MKLYKKDSNGGTRIWEINARELSYEISYGLIDGEKQFESYPVIEGLAGRTIEEQISLRVNARVQKKKNGGYNEDIKNVGYANKNQLGFFRPMKAFKYSPKAPIDLVNCFIQRKYDGHRCLINCKNGVLSAYSNGGKAITSIEHILAAIRLEEGETVDGELYIHGLKLQQISSKVRVQGLQSPDLMYIIYDKICDRPFIHRISDLIELQINSDSVKIAETINVSSINEIDLFFMEFRKNGYEGAIVRQGTKGYEAGKRSKSVLKVKEFDDDEFKVIGIVASVEGWARLVCVTSHGKKFKCSAPGNEKEKRRILSNPEYYIGKSVRVEYAGLTLAGIPSQPVAKMWRNKDEE